ncbi:hypothetical protein I3J27_10060 [Bradyrhizobium xenonodulans]|uniref:Type 4 secretion system PilS N-terminal domain-containing protein n=1 Tax=Bradyrhizobium xenonodulans TaxID=2736875 RepID=A0ABY7MUW0_9BRAD|nr:hypothetical protein [Bradyrhizobium xenonodulans]WBL80740.1 hypothetical protein I3J27_10060 [Bradyrhizobium xenonodulans]
MFSGALIAAVLSLAVTVFSAIFPDAARAAGLQNKTFSVTWSQFVPADCADGTTNKYPRAVSQQIYVSSLGRVFSKTSNQAGNASNQKLGVSGAGTAFHASGNQIVGTFPQLSGASRETVTLDASGQSCTASVVVGTESKKPFSWRNLVGVTCTATGATTISNVSCSVREGNAFAN